jgi:hypothetical protein
VWMMSAGQDGFIRVWVSSTTRGLLLADSSAGHSHKFSVCPQLLHALGRLSSHRFASHQRSSYCLLRLLGWRKRSALFVGHSQPQHPGRTRSGSCRGRDLPGLALDVGQHYLDCNGWPRQYGQNLAACAGRPLFQASSHLGYKSPYASRVLAAATADAALGYPALHVGLRRDRLFFINVRLRHRHRYRCILVERARAVGRYKIMDLRLYLALWRRSCIWCAHQ